jgi:hypothetical protein
MTREELQTIQDNLGQLLPFVQHALPECTDEECKCGLTKAVIDFAEVLNNAKAG